MGDVTPLVYWFVGRWRKLARSVELDDLRQAVWLGVIESLRTFDPGKGRLSTHARRYVQRHVTDLIRTERLHGLHVPYRGAGGDVRFGPVPEDMPARADDEQTDRGGWPELDRLLSPREAEVIRLLAGGWVRPDIARHLGISRQAVQCFERRAKAKLRAAA